MKKTERKRVGVNMQKVLILLAGGLALGLTNRPDTYFKIVRGISEEWKDTNNRALRDAITQLHWAELIDYIETKDGKFKVILTSEGKRTTKKYDLNNMQIRKPTKWDGKWRIITFDIPEKFKSGRDALRSKLEHLGFYRLQKSTYVFPFECKNEVSFIVGFFKIQPFVRSILAINTDIDVELKKHYRL